MPRLLLLLLGWGAAATLAGSVHLVAHLPPGAVPVIVASLAIGLSVAAARVGWIAAAIGAIGVRRIVAAHLVRFVGFYFLWLHAQGRLPAEFAHRAGWGDVAAAVGALVILCWPEGAGFRRALLVWNVFAMLDLFVAVGTGARANFARPGSMAEIAGLPLALVPLWLVPVLMASHVVIFRRFLRRDAAAAGRLARA